MTTKQIACGNRKVHGFTPGFQHHHTSVDEVRKCFDGWTVLSQEESSQIDLDTYDPDAAYERHLENAGYDEARLQEDIEAAMGITDEAYHGPQDHASRGIVEATEQPEPDFAALPDGTYTVDRSYGHRTFQVKTQKDDAKFAPGKRILSVLSGSDNEADYTGIGFIGRTEKGKHYLGPWKAYHESGPLTQELAKRLLEDPRSALVAGRCARCSRKLTTPESLARGLGEHCARKG